MHWNSIYSLSINQKISIGIRFYSFLERFFENHWYKEKFLQFTATLSECTSNKSSENGTFCITHCKKMKKVPFSELKKSAVFGIRIDCMTSLYSLKKFSTSNFNGKCSHSSVKIYSSECEWMSYYSRANNPLATHLLMSKFSHLS